MEILSSNYMPGIQTWAWYLMRMAEAGGITLAIAASLGCSQLIFGRWVEKTLEANYESQ